MIRNYWLVAIRKLLRHKIHSVINILGLTIGIASCLIIFLLTRYELSTDSFQKDKDRIYRVVALRGSALEDPRKIGYLPSSVPPILQTELTGCEAVAGFYLFNTQVTIPGQGNRESSEPHENQESHESSALRAPRHFDAPEQGATPDIVIAMPDYFKIFHYQWLAGSPATSLNEPYRVVLTSNQLRRYFGNITPAAAIGRQVIYRDSLPVYVSGIVKSWDHPNTDFAFNDFISFATAEHTFLKDYLSIAQLGNWGGIVQGFVKLAPRTKPAQVERQFPAFVKKYLDPGPGSIIQLHLQPLRDIHFNADYLDMLGHKAHLPTLYGLMAIAVFILLLAAINFINLSTAQSLQRTKEIGIRKVLGSRRKDIAVQFLGETFLTTLLATSLSVLITPMILTLLHNYLPHGVTLTLTPVNIAFLIGITVITGLLAGSYPAKVISALLPVLSLKGQATRGLQPNRYLNRALIVFQFTISLAFIMCTVIVTRQLHYVLNTDLGFDKDAIVTFRTHGNYPAQDREVLAQKLRALPGIAMVTRHAETPEATRHGGTDIEYKGAEDRQSMASFETCDTNYLRLFGIPLVAGRDIFPNDSVHEFLINETCAKQLGFKRPGDALGQKVLTGMNGWQGPVVGVVRDFHSQSLHEAITPFFMIDNPRGERTISIKLARTARTPEAVAAILRQVAALWKATFPNEKFAYSFLDESIANLYEQEQKISDLLRLAMGIAIFISCMGLLGLASFAAGQRSKEISIRKVLGASITSIVTLLTGSFLWPVALAIVIATPVAWYFMQRWLQGFAYRTTVPWWLFVCCGLAAIAIAFLTVSFQAVRTATANPVDKLRAE
ncbi:MAG TPA: ABC transporter permease [Puia sp.]|nr:ABC transporter permease [Puia sp.]